MCRTPSDAERISGMQTLKARCPEHGVQPFIHDELPMWWHCPYRYELVPWVPGILGLGCVWVITEENFWANPDGGDVENCWEVFRGGEVLPVERDYPQVAG
jgi:hypothetical protein